MTDYLEPLTRPATGRLVGNLLADERNDDGSGDDAAADVLADNGLPIGVPAIGVVPTGAVPTGVVPTGVAPEDDGVPDDGQPPRAGRLGALGRMGGGGFERIAAVTASLVGTQAITSILGFVYWTLAARRFSASAVGLAAAATSSMQLLGSIGMLGLGTLLISRLFHVDRARRRLLVRSALIVVGAVSSVLGFGFAIVVQFLPSHSLAPLGSSPGVATLFALGVATTGVTLVLDQAVLALGSGLVQLERNILASVTKLVLLVALSMEGQRGGMAIYLSWTLGTVASLLFVVWRTRGGWKHQESRRVFAVQPLRGLGRDAANHHMLNLALQAPLMLLSPIVALEVSTTANGYFATVVLVCGFVFVLPYAMSIGLFASSRGDGDEALRRMRLTLPFGLIASLGADIVIYPCAGLILSAFGSSYATHGASSLRLLVLAGLPFVIKDHYIALRRIQGRTAEAARGIAVTAALEIAAAVLGARMDGVTGLCVAWVSMMFVEAAFFAVPLLRDYRGSTANIEPSAPTGRAGAGGGAVTAVRTIAAPATLVPAAARSTVGQPSRRSVAALTPTAVSTPSSSRRPRSLAGPGFFVVCLGLFVEALTSVTGRDGTTPAVVDVLFWLGLILILLPPALAVLSTSSSRQTRRGAVVVAALAFQVSRLMLFPSQFVFHDELDHANTLRLIQGTHHLFGANPLLPVSSSYPGLELATDAVHNLFGLANRPAAIVVLLLARLTLTLAILLGVERFTRSGRIAAVAALVYMCNQQFLFFNSQYSYQTLALPLALLSIYLLLRPHPGRGGGIFRATDVVLPLAAIAATTVTHHLTAMLLATALSAWWIAERRLHPGSALGRALTWCAPASVVMAAAWALRPGNPALSYLRQIGSTGFAAVTAFVGGKQSHRLFADSSGYQTPKWEVVVSLGSEIALVACVVLALRSAWRGRSTRAASMALLLSVLALAYPLVPAGHLTAATSEVTDRAAGFLFVGVALAIAIWIVGRRATLRGARLGLTALVFVLVFVGQTILGSGPQWAQTPGPYLVSADSRSLDAYNLAAARWAGSTLGAGSRVLADRDASLLAGAIAGLYPVSHIADGINASGVILSPTWTPTDLALVHELRIEFVIVDQRDASGLPRMGVYYESGEYGQDRTTPVPEAALTKLSAVPGVQRIYDSGAVVIYDLRALLPASR